MSSSVWLILGWGMAWTILGSVIFALTRGVNRRIQNAAVVHRAARNNLLPRLDLVASMGSKGGGDNWQKAVKGSYVDWLFREYSIGLQFEVPLGNREARGIEKRTMLQRLQSIDQYRLLIERVSNEVKDAHDQVITGWDRIVVARKARLSSRYALDAIVASAPGQVVLLQTGLPAPRIPSGYYFVQSVTPDGGGQGAIRGGYEVENHVLQLTEAGIPAGTGSDWSGTTWNDVLAAFPTWQDVVDDVGTWLDLARGEW